MKKRKAILVGFLLTILLGSIDLFAETAEDEALTVAETWLALVDAGEYAESWNQSAQLFKNAITMEKWAQALNMTRQPLGNLVHRKKKSAQFANALPGAPDGEYVVIQFAASFEHKQSAIETVTPMRDPDGVWRVSGYFIK